MSAERIAKLPFCPKHGQEVLVRATYNNRAINDKWSWVRIAGASEAVAVYSDTLIPFPDDAEQSEDALYALRLTDDERQAILHCRDEHDHFNDGDPEEKHWRSFVGKVERQGLFRTEQAQHDTPSPKYLSQEAVDYAAKHGFTDPGWPAMDNVVVARAYDAGRLKPLKGPCESKRLSVEPDV